MFGNLPFPGEEGRRFSLRVYSQPNLGLEAASVVWHGSLCIGGTGAVRVRELLGGLGVAVAYGTSCLSACCGPGPVASSALVLSGPIFRQKQRCRTLLSIKSVERVKSISKYSARIDHHRYSVKLSRGQGAALFRVGLRICDSWYRTACRVT